MIILKLVFKEFKNNPYFNLLFILNLSIGISGFMALDIFKYSLDSSIKARSKSILGADLSLSSRRPLTKKERQIVFKLAGANGSETKVIETFSMAGSEANQSRLVHIKAVEKSFPFYGAVHLRRQGKISKTADSDLHEKQAVWVYPEILIQLKAKIGDYILIGNKKFLITDVVEQDDSMSITAGSGIAPRVYVSLKNLKTSGLMRPSSLAWHTRLYKIPNKSSDELLTLRKNIFDQLDDPAVEVETHENAGAEMGRMLNYLNDFLSLAALCALFLTCAGMGFLFHSYLKRKITQTAILISLGLSRWKAFTLRLVYIFVLGIMSWITAFGFGLLILPFLKLAVKSFLPFEIQLQINTLGFSLILAVFAPLLIGLPFSESLRKLQPSLLLQPLTTVGTKWSAAVFLLLVPGIIFLWGAAVFHSHSFKIGTLFTALLGAFSGILALTAYGALAFIEKINYFSSNILRWALRDICRLKSAFISCFVCLGIGLLLINIIPQIQNTIAQEINNPGRSSLPSLFLFDIQEGQTRGLNDLLSQNNMKADRILPMVRARLLSVNAQAFDKGKGRGGKAWSREQERSARFRNRGFNLSSSNSLHPSEKIIKGRPLKGFYNKDKEKTLPGISVETRFAERLGFKMGDILDFEISGETISGQIQNIRSVHWLSFQPNFFILFQQGALSQAPKTFIASIPSLSADKKNELQNQIINNFSNISMVDISRVTKQLLALAGQIALALQLMSLFCILAGFVVLYSITSHQARSRKWDIGLLKTLGLSLKETQSLFLCQFAGAGLAASLFGVLASFACSYLLSIFLFQHSDYVFSLKTPLLTLIGAAGVCLAVTWFASRKLLQTTPLKLFKATD